MLKKIGLGLFLFLVVAATLVFLYLNEDTKDKYEAVEYDQSMIPHFLEVQVPFKNKYDAENSLPILGSAIMDIDGDGVEELLVGGGKGQQDAWFRFENGQFTNIREQIGFEKEITHTTYGTSVIDMTGDGLADILVARDTAVYLYENQKGHFNKPKNLNLSFNEKSQAVSITVADLNRDGWVDLFVSAYLKKHLMEGQTIFNKENYGGTSQLFLNNGDNTFSDITKAAGLYYVHNTFSAVFVDFNNDGLEDLVVAHDTGEPRIYQNRGDLKFEMVAHPLTGLFSYPMGIAVGDYDNNGFQDVFFSNVGSSLPEAFVRGDLREDQTLVTDWILLANEGDFKFVNKANSAKVANYEFSWGAVFEDFNMNGLQDLVVSENYVDLPNSKILPLPSRFLMQLPDHTFTNIESENKTTNPCNGISPLVADFNGDGFPDLVHVNLDGEVKVFISKGNTGSNYLKIKLPETPAYLNAVVSLEKNDGSRITLQKTIGEGFASDQSHTLFFGLGKETQVKSCQLKLVDKTVKEIQVSQINTTMYVE